MEEIVYLSIRLGCTAYLLYKVWEQKKRIGKICDLLYTPRKKPEMEKDHHRNPENAADVMGATRFVYLDENAGKTVAPYMSQQLEMGSDLIGKDEDIPEDELFTDAFSLLQFLDDMSDDEHNRFTKRDILDAMQFYQENYVTYSRREAERVSAIAMPASKRNGRKQAEHLERARLVQTLDYPNGAWRNKEGRPKGSGEKSKIVEEWKQQHPDGKKIDCERETGLSRHTVLKWWK